MVLKKGIFVQLTIKIPPKKGSFGQYTQTPIYSVVFIKMNTICRGIFLFFIYFLIIWGVNWGVKSIFYRMGNSTKSILLLKNSSE